MLNQVEMDASSTLRRIENVFYPLALCVASPPSPPVDAAPKMPESSQVAATNTLPAPTEPPKEVVQMSTMGKEKEASKEKAFESVKLLPMPKEPSKENEATQGQVLGQAKLSSTTTKGPREKGAAQATVPEPSVLTIVKVNPLPSKTN